MLNLKAAIESNYDVVKVDLADGRDYPIYIGTSYTDQELSRMLTSHIRGKQAFIITNDSHASSCASVAQVADTIADSMQLHGDWRSLPPTRGNPCMIASAAETPVKRRRVDSPPGRPSPVPDEDADLQRALDGDLRAHVHLWLGRRLAYSHSGLAQRTPQLT